MPRWYYKPAIIGFELQERGATGGPNVFMEENLTGSKHVVTIRRQHDPPQNHSDIAEYPNPILSDPHAVIEFTRDGRLNVIDKSSERGTFRVREGRNKFQPDVIPASIPLALEEGDVIQLGSFLPDDPASPLWLEIKPIYNRTPLSEVKNGRTSESRKSRSAAKAVEETEVLQPSTPTETKFAASIPATGTRQANDKPKGQRDRKRKREAITSETAESSYNSSATPEMSAETPEQDKPKGQRGRKRKRETITSETAESSYNSSATPEMLAETPEQLAVARELPQLPQKALKLDTTTLPEYKRAKLLPEYIDLTVLGEAEADPINATFANLQVTSADSVPSATDWGSSINTAIEPVHSLVNDSLLESTDIGAAPFAADDDNLQNCELWLPPDISFSADEIPGLGSQEESSCFDWTSLITDPYENEVGTATKKNTQTPGKEAAVIDSTTHDARDASAIGSRNELHREPQSDLNVSIPISESKLESETTKGIQDSNHDLNEAGDSDDSDGVPGFSPPIAPVTDVPVPENLPVLPEPVSFPTRVSQAVPMGMTGPLRVETKLEDAANLARSSAEIIEPEESEDVFSTPAPRENRREIYPPPNEQISAIKAFETVPILTRATSAQSDISSDLGDLRMRPDFEDNRNSLKHLSDSSPESSPGVNLLSPYLGHGNTLPRLRKCFSHR